MNALLLLAVVWIDVGAPGNPPLRGQWGAVDYSYRVSAQPVTAGEVADFLNNAHLDMPSPLSGPGSNLIRDGESWRPRGTASDPALGVDWLTAARYVNWVHSGGQATEDGVYTLVDSPTVVYSRTGSALRFPGQTSLTRNPGASVYLPTLHEATKAAVEAVRVTNWEYADLSIVRNYCLGSRDCYGPLGIVSAVGNDGATGWINPPSADTYMAYGFRLYSPATEPQLAIRGDSDADGDVDSVDLLAFVGAWTGSTGTNSPSLIWSSRSDFDRDDDVDSLDLLELIGGWTGASAVRAVPEPSYRWTLAVMWMLGIFCAARAASCGAHK